MKYKISTIKYLYLISVSTWNHNSNQSENVEVNLVKSKINHVMIGNFAKDTINGCTSFSTVETFSTSKSDLQSFFRTTNFRDIKEFCSSFRIMNVICIWNHSKSTFRNLEQFKKSKNSLKNANLHLRNLASTRLIHGNGAFSVF